MKIINTGNLITTLLFSAMLIGGACTKKTNPEANSSVAPSTTTTITTPTQQPITEQQLQGIKKSETDFAFASYAKIKTDGNFVYSPYSLWGTLTMAYAGANGVTKTQMAKVLGLDANDPTIHAGIGALEQNLKASGLGNDGFKLKIVNDLWAKKGTHFFEQFLETLRVNYGARPNELVSVSAVNDHVKKATDGKINDLIPEQDIAYIDLIQTNAIYLKGKWLSKFDKVNTRLEEFTSPNGVVKVDMMNNVGTFRIALAKEYDAVEMPYIGDKFAMLAILPKGKLEELERTLSTDFLKQVRKDLLAQEIRLAFPKFTIESSSKPLPALGAMGMQSLSFSLISKDMSLTLGQIYHKAFIEVDEEGTTAAAATAVIMDWESSRPEPVTIKFNRPFVTLIWHKESGAVLFMSRVTNPKPS